MEPLCVCEGIQHEKCDKQNRIDILFTILYVLRMKSLWLSKIFWCGCHAGTLFTLLAATFLVLYLLYTEIYCWVVYPSSRVRSFTIRNTAQKLTLHKRNFFACSVIRRKQENDSVLISLMLYQPTSFHSCGIGCIRCFVTEMGLASLELGSFSWYDNTETIM